MDGIGLNGFGFGPALVLSMYFQYIGVTLGVGSYYPESEFATYVD